MQVLLMKYMMTLLKVLLLLMCGLVQLLKVLVVLQRITLDGKYFGVVMFKLQVELIIQEQQL